MYKFMQRNRKKMLAVFAVGLMIVFILPQVAFDQQPRHVAGSHRPPGRRGSDGRRGAAGDGAVARRRCATCRSRSAP